MGGSTRDRERLSSTAFSVVLCVSACGGARPVAAPSPSSAPGASGSPPAAKPAPPEPAGEKACGALACRAFEQPEDAFRATLRERPLVLAIGEAHALERAADVPTTPRRFSDRLLPIVAQMGASDLVIELLLPDPNCKPKAADVEREQAAVTAPQAPTNQSDYVELGRAAERLGLDVHALKTTCADYDRILADPDAAVLVTLELIRDRTIDVVERLLERRREQGAAPFVVVYGGAMHNDIEPKQGREAFSFGQKLSQRTLGRYVALDLIVPEYIKQNETWQALPWFAHYDAGRFATRAVLFSPEPASFVLVLPRSTSASAPP